MNHESMRSMGSRWFRNRRLALAAAALIGSTAVAYLPSLDGGFIWDDKEYVVENETLVSADGLRRIWLELGAVPHQYFPMVHTTFWVEHQLWQLDPRGYRVDNLILHIAVALLLWLNLRTLRVPGAWLAALVFAVHPVQAETVAWITERKNLLSTLFYMAAGFCYLRWLGLRHCSESDEPEESDEIARGESTGPITLYLASLALFVLALLSKTVVCSLPAVLLLIQWWKRSRLELRDVVVLIPFFAAGGGFALLSIAMESGPVGAARELADLDIFDRVLIAGRALWFYAGKLVWPTQLSFVYPRWEIDAGQWQAWLYPLSALLAGLLLLASHRKLDRGVSFALLAYAGTLLPILGFFDVYFMRYSFVQDHFQYLASPFLIGLLIALIVTAAKRMGRRSQLVVRAMAALAVASLCALTLLHSRQYRSDEILWLTTLEKNPAAWIAHGNLGWVYQEDGQLDKAFMHTRRALALHPAAAELQRNLGSLLAKNERFEEAEPHYRAALEIAPRDMLARRGLVGILELTGRGQQARELEAAWTRADRKDRRTSAAGAR